MKAQCLKELEEVLDQVSHDDDCSICSVAIIFVALFSAGIL